MGVCGTRLRLALLPRPSQHAPHPAHTCSALSGDVAWDEVGAIASWTEVILLLESTEEGGDGKRGNRSAALLSQACRVFPLDNAQARAQEVEVGADLQRIRARSKAMLLAAGLVIPGLDSARGGGAGQGQGRAPITPGGGALTAVDGASPALPAAGSRGVPVAGAMGVDLQF